MTCKHYITAFGETKKINDWLMDSRCKIHRTCKVFIFTRTEYRTKEN